MAGRPSLASTYTGVEASLKVATDALSDNKPIDGLLGRPSSCMHAWVHHWDEHIPGSAYSLQKFRLQMYQRLFKIACLQCILQRKFCEYIASCLPKRLQSLHLKQPSESYNFVLCCQAFRKEQP